jgi:hypothetical protein
MFTSWEKILINVGITTFVWLTVTLLTKPSSLATLQEFESLIFGPEGKFKNFPFKILGFLLGTIGVYSLLFGVGKIIYGDYSVGAILCISFAVCTGLLYFLRGKILE